MKNFFLKLGRKFRTFMYGRYGFDELTGFLSVATVLFVVLALFWRYFNIVAWLILLYSVFRIYSRNIAARSRERAFYLRIRTKVQGFFRLRKNKFRDRKTHRYYKCPSCRSMLRVPRGRGKIEITCPRCGKKFIKKS